MAWSSRTEIVVFLHRAALSSTSRINKPLIWNAATFCNELREFFKTPAAREYFQQEGRRGGKIGGKVRAEKLSKARRQEIAKKAAEARWARTRTMDARRTVLDELREMINRDGLSLQERAALALALAMLGEKAQMSREVYRRMPHKMELLDGVLELSEE